MTKTNQFWNKVAPKYAAKAVPDEAVYQQKLAMSQAIFTDDMSVMELGCGTGSTAMINAPYVKNYYASDISETMIEIANTKLANSHIGNLQFTVESVQKSLQNASLAKDPQYDVILAHSLLHLLPDPVQTLESIYASLKPGGYFISSTVCMGDNLAWFRFIAPIGQFLGLMPMLNIFKKQDYASWHHQTGFTIINNWTPESSKHTSFIIAQKQI